MSVQMFTTRGQSDMDVVILSERAEILEAITEHNRTAMRLPAHFVDRRAALHRQINDLLTMLELLP